MTTTIENPDQDNEEVLAEFLPFRLEPKFAERIWGRQSLKPWYELTGTDKLVGEAWLTGPDCVVATGELQGKKLSDALDDFPLLVKMLFPAEKLSVQVHPDDEQAQAQGHERGKTECWYVLEAEPGATVACGLKHGVSVDHVQDAVKDGTMEDLMEWLPVSPGDMVFVDAGTVHAIGPGVTLLEVQQTSDVTYRLYDYGRPRELHLKQGLEVVKTKTAAGKVKPKQMGRLPPAYRERVLRGRSLGDGARARGGDAHGRHRLRGWTTWRGGGQRGTLQRRAGGRGAGRLGDHDQHQRRNLRALLGATPAEPRIGMLSDEW